MKKILIVKLSSLGDVVQSLRCALYLKEQFREVEVDWVVQEPSRFLLESFSCVDNVIVCDINEWKKNKFCKNTYKKINLFLHELRRKEYDAVFDLQGNCKSAFVTFFAKSSNKIGFSKKNVREWPNILVTNRKFSINEKQNMRLQYLSLLEQYFNKKALSLSRPLKFIRQKDAEDRVNALMKDSNLQNPLKIMVCPNSKWKNKQLSYEKLLIFLKHIKNNLNPSFLFIHGNEKEEKIAIELQKQFSSSSIVVPRLKIDIWHCLMEKMNLIISMDSCALHLAGSVSIPTYSIFGPTKAKIFKPIGKTCGFYQIECPHNITFDKCCPRLRKCETRSCMDQIDVEDLISNFSSWWDKNFSLVKI
jgi:heptosyltransferase-1